MQIFHWLFKVTREQARDNTSYHTNKEITNGKGAKTKHIILYKKGGVYRRRSSKRVKGSDHHLGGNCFMPFALCCRKDVAKACFYSTLDLRRLRSFNRRQHCHWIHSTNKMKREEIAKGLGSNHKADPATHAGNKVLPISDASLSSSSTNTRNEQCGTVTENKKDSNKLGRGDKTKTMSRMKELLRWAAAAAKSEKGGKFIGRKVLHFRHRSTLKAVPDDDLLSNESPKISFRWEVESRSTTSSVYSRISMASSSKNNIACNTLSSVSSTPIHHDINHLCTPRKGNWITTDSEFVVLEL